MRISCQLCGNQLRSGPALPPAPWSQRLSRPPSQPASREATHPLSQQCSSQTLLWRRHGAASRRQLAHPNGLQKDRVVIAMGCQRSTGADTTGNRRRSWQPPLSCSTPSLQLWQEFAAQSRYGFCPLDLRLLCALCGIFCKRNVEFGRFSCSKQMEVMLIHHASCRRSLWTSRSMICKSSMRPSQRVPMLHLSSAKGTWQR